MKRIKMFLLAIVMAVVIGGAAAGSTNATEVPFNLSIPATGANCDGQLETSGGPPPANITLIGSSFEGTAGSSNPCNPAEYRVNNNPVVTFSGSGPYSASINSISITELASSPSCTYTFSGTSLTSSGSVSGPYSGTDTGSGSGAFLCFFFPPATITFDEARFTPATLHIEIPKLSIDCDARMDTTKGTLPGDVKLLGATFAGDPTGSNPCDPNAFKISNDPSVTFSGSGPYNATIDRIDFNNGPMTGCTVTTLATSLTSPGTVRGPYSGTDTATGSGGFVCNAFTDTVTISDLNFP